MKSQEELLLMYKEYNKSEIFFEEKKDVIDYFKENVCKYPQKQAVVYADKILTYRQLDEMSDCIAKKLIEKGVQAGDCVAVLMNNKMDFIVSVVGIVKINATYVPIDPEYFDDRIHYLLESAQAKVLITDSDGINRFPVGVLYEDLLVNTEGSFERVSFLNPILCVMYTSGTTGTPKGVMIPQKGIIRLVIDGYYKYKETDRMLQTSTVVFDISLQEIWGSLMNGITLYVTTKQDILEATRFEQLLKKYQTNFAFMATALFAELVRQKLDVFASLETLIIGGDTLYPASVKLLYDACPNTTLINVYGPTENTVLTTYYVVKREDVNSKVIPIGTPIAKTNVYIMDNNNQLCDIKCKGELCVGGFGIANQYLNNPELSKKRFVYIDALDEVVYKTGDFAMINNDGNILFFGREDNQVKVRGYRIELDEIRMKMLEYPAIQTVFVAVEKDSTDNKVICVYYVASDVIAPAEIRAYLKEQLPAYSMPNYFYQMKEFPLKVNDKIDQDRLMGMKSETINERKTNETEDLTKTERVVLNIFNELFYRDDMCVDDDFFQEGGNSLQVGQVIARIRKELLVDISARAFFMNSKVSQLAAYIDSSSKHELDVKLQRHDEKDFYCLSEAQKRIFYSCYTDKNSVVYNIPYAFCVEGNMDLSRLKMAFSKLVECHSILRAVFLYQDEEPLQKIIDTTEFVENRLSVLEETRGAYREDMLSECFSEFIKPFDYENGPLWRCKLIHYDGGKNLLLFDIHHLIFDGASQKTFFSELSKFYQNIAAEQEPVQFDYLDYVQWNQSQKNSDSYKQNSLYWKSFFEKDIKGLDIRGKRNSQQNDEKGIAQFRLPLSVVDSVNRKIQDEHITLYNYVISCLGIVLSKFFDQRLFYIGSILAGRNIHQFLDVIGMFVNTTLFKVDINPTENLMSFMARNKLQIIQMIDNQDYSLEDIIKCNPYAEELDKSDLLQTVFVMQNMEVVDLDLGKMPVRRLDIANNKAKFDLLFICENEPDGLLFQLEYRKSAIEQVVAESLCGAIKFVLISAFGEISNQVVGDICISDESQKELILKKFNNTSSNFDASISLGELFKSEVKKHPDLSALLWQGRKISYQELDYRTDMVAASMIKSGIKQGDVVALYLEDKLNQIEGILAVLKTGAVYMPIDTGYPKKRVEYMINDGGARYILIEKSNEHREEIAGVNHIVIDSQEILETETIEKTDFAICNGESLAYLMYTSGTMGTPKGVMVKHKNIIRLVKNTNFMEFQEGVSFLQTSSVVFDASTLEIWGSLLNGMCLCLTRKEDILNASKLRKYIKEWKIDALWLSAPLFNQISQGNEDMFEGVTWLLVGGDRLPAKQIHKVREANKKLRVLNGYGPTENTTFSTIFEVDDEYDDIPIGYPISNSTVYIMDQSKKILPIGALGEICVGGAGIAAGYIRDDELTRKKFITNPYQTEDRIYCTGDIGRWNEKGYIEFLGRKDNQVKIRGFRVEMKEIESVVCKANVRECLVDVREKDGNKFLVLFYVGDISQSDLNGYIKENLPEYMRPSYLIRLDGMVLNVNGKIDYETIRKIDLSEISYAVNNSNTLEEPENELQKIMCEVWQEVLGVDKVGITDNYYDLGGDSIKAISISGKLYQNRIDVSAADVLTTRNIKALSKIADTIANDKEIQNGKYELSPIQNWFFEHVKEDWNHFNQSVILELKKRITMKQIIDAWEILRNHHELLNAYFDCENDVRHMVIDTKASTTEFVEIALEGEAQFIISQEAEKCQRALDIEKGPLCRIVLFSGETQQYLLIVMHHLIVDNVSWRILINDFYGVLVGKKGKSGVWNKTASYLEWIRDIDKYVNSVFEPTDITGVNDKFMGNTQKTCMSGQMHMIKKSLDEKSTAHLISDIHQRYHTKVQDILIAAFVCATKKCSEENTISIQMESYGRENDYSKLNVSETIGWFTSIYPVEIAIAGDDYGKQIVEVKDRMNQVQNHGIGYNAYYYGKKANNRTQDNCFVSFNFLGTFEDDLQNELFKASEYSSGNEVTDCYIRCSLDINAEVKNGCLEVRMDYGNDLYSKDQMQVLIDNFFVEIVEIINHCMSSQESFTTSSDYSVEGLDANSMDDIFASLQGLSL